MLGLDFARILLSPKVNSAERIALTAQAHNIAFKLLNRGHIDRVCV